MNNVDKLVDVAKLTEAISEIINNIFQKKIDGLDDIEFKKIKGKNRIYLSSDRYIELSSKEKQFLSKLMDYEDFKCKVKNIQEESKLLNFVFDRFKERLGILITEIESYGVDELKGRCKECSRWVRLFGDC